MSHLNINLN